MKRFAIITLTDLKLRKFDSRDELDGALKEFNSRAIPVVVFRWSDLGGCYAVMEQHI